MSIIRNCTIFTFLFALIAVSLCQLSQLYIHDISKTTICNHYTPCGWEVYQDFYTYTLSKYYLFSHCVCPLDKYCVRNNQDFAIHAFVYKCKDDIDDILAPDLPAALQSFRVKDSLKNIASPISPSQTVPLGGSPSRQVQASAPKATRKPISSHQQIS